MTMTRAQNLQIHLSVDPDPTDSVNPDPKPQGPHQNVAIIAWTRGCTHVKSVQLNMSWLKYVPPAASWQLLALILPEDWLVQA